MFEESFACGVCSTVTDGSVTDGHCHDSLKEILLSASQNATLAPRKEVPSLIPDSQSCPADVYLPHWKRGKPAGLDVTVISPLQPLLVKSTALSQGYALLVREERKLKAHFTVCHLAGIYLSPH